MLESLDALIATVGVILGLSLIVQAIQQIIKQAFDLKTCYMRDELISMFVDKWKKIERVPEISKLKDATREQIDSLIGILEAKMRGIGFKDLELLENIDAAKLKNIFESVPVEEAITNFKGNVQTLREDINKEIDRWFELAKRAFQDHYERRMKVWAFGISAIVVMVMNVNLYDTYTLFTTNSAAREAGLSLATNLGKISADSLAKVMSVDAGKVKSDSLIKVGIEEKAMFANRLIEDKTFQFFGWRGAAWHVMCARLWYENVFIIPFGWLAMALLVSLGAPFWYDLLKSLMGVKNMLKGKSGNG